MKKFFRSSTSAAWIAISFGSLIVALAALVWLGSMPVSAAPSAFVKGDVFVGVGSGRIKRFDQNGTLLQTLDTTTGSSEDTGMCFDAAGNLYATIFSVNKMAKFDNSGTLLNANWGSGFNQHPESCVVNIAQSIYAGQADGTGNILKFNTAGTPQGSFAAGSGGRGSDWIDLEADQCTMLYGSEGPNVKRYNVCTSTQLSDFAGNLGSSCYAVRQRSNGEVMVACQSKVLRLNSSGTPVMTYTAPLSVSFFFALNLDPDGTSFWSADISNCNVVKFSIATGAILKAWNGGRLGASCAGLTVFGELTQAAPPPAPVVAPPAQVPEGDTLMLVGTGLAGLAGYATLRWRARRGTSVAKPKPPKL